MQENTRGCTILGKTVPGEVLDGRETWRKTERANDDGSWVEPGLAATDKVSWRIKQTVWPTQNRADDDMVSCDWTHQYAQS